MNPKLYKDITVVVILYNTPSSKILNLKQYKNFKLTILEQGSVSSSKKKIEKLLNFKFKYYYLKKNLGLSKGINFLIKKAKTKYCMITEPDIQINEKSIINLKKTIKFNNNFLLVGPNYNNRKITKSYKIVKNIDTSCVLVETKKILKFNFYDEDFFFFWQDIDLVKRINDSNFDMVVNKNSPATHFMSGSSERSLFINFLRERGYKYGELIFDYKYNNLRFLKISRQLFQSVYRTCIYTLFFDKKKILRNLGYFNGILSFLLFYLNRKIKFYF